MKVCIISKDATYGNCAILAKGLSEFAKTVLVLGYKDKKNMYLQYKSRIGYRKIPKADRYIIVGAITLDELKDRDIKVRRDVVIFTDTRYLRNPMRYNLMARHSRVFAMPDLIKYREGLPTEVYYQPFDIDIPIIKNQEVTVCHSPYHVSKLNAKGSLFISDIVNMFPVRYSYIMERSWMDTIEEKSKAHIFIDQMGDNPGIGKSGLEAMLLDCLVISSGDLDFGDIPKPPVVLIKREELYDTLKHFIYNAGARNELILEQKAWAKKYLNKRLWAKRLLA